MKSFTLLELPTFEDSRGVLTVLDDLIPFEIRRLYWIYGADDKVRGGHRHKITHQALISVSGTVEVYMNDGVDSEIIKLDSPSKCLLVMPKDWHNMSFGKNAVLLVIASHPYDRSDYIDEKY